MPVMLDPAPHDPADPGPLPRATVNAVVHLGREASVVMIPLEMVEGPDATMRLAAPGPRAAIALGDRVHPGRPLAIVGRLVPREMMIATALPVTTIRPLTRMRPPVSLIALRGASSKH